VLDLRSIADGLLPPSLHAKGVDAVRRGRLALAACATGIVGGLFGALTVTLNPSPGQLARALVYLGMSLWGIVIVAVLRRTGSLLFVGHGIATGVFVACSFALLQSGNLGLPVVSFLALVSPVVVIIAGVRAGACWALAAMAVPVVVYRMHAAGFAFPAEVADPDLRLIQAVGTVFIVLVGLFLGVAFEVLKNAALRDLRVANRALAGARDAALDAARAKAEFLATMSHEIRTPMNGVIGMTQLLLDTPLSDDQRDLVQTIRSSGDALLSIVNDVLDYSKIEAGGLDLELRPVELGPVVREVLDLFVAGAVEKGLELDWEIADGVPPRILGDAMRIRQVLVNLIGNAIKFTLEGRVDVTVRVAAAADGGAQIVVAVRDTGIGIAPESMPSLFRSFSQVDSSTARRFGGTGLGLAISKRLAQAMGGDVTAESVPGRGSTFRFVFPARAIEAAGAAPDRESARDDGAALGARHPLRILLAEDNRVNQKVALRLLERMGYHAEVAANGLEVLAALEREPFDVILMDVQMPELDGLEATRRIRALAGVAQPRIIAMTANVMAREREQCVAAGMDDYVAKPVDRRALATALLACSPVAAVRRTGTLA
jgi:signal transduction histidine kinase/ActR/RegA family two-component response regulator